MTEIDPIQQALELPGGARFFKCALQINPYEYLARHGKTTLFSDEATYNEAIIRACKEQEIEVIAVTDHYRIRSSVGLWQAARAAGLHVFPGFEAVTKEGAHFLCLFDPDRPREQLERILGDCGIHDENAASPTGKYDVLELLEQARGVWKAVCIAAHVASEGGLLRMLTGQPRINAWRSSDLAACSLPGPVKDAPDELRPILENKNPEYRRDRPVTVINAQDVCGPDDLVKPATSCWIKMSDVSINGLHQAFLDSDSRIRLSSDPVPEAHIELAAVTWQGGFLDGQKIHFNENLNVLIGGRGTGKSTIVESLRYVLGLDPLGEEARKAHEGIVQNVIKNGTRLSLLVCSQRPSRCEYRIERTAPNPPIVRDEHGQVLNLTPKDVLPNVEIYGQHEIAELAKSPEKLTRLLERFAERDLDLVHRKSELKQALQRSRTRILEVREESQQVEERLAALPGLEETLKRFHEAGLEERLKEQSLLVREERVLKTASERLSPFRELLDQVQRELPIDRAFLAQKAIEELPSQAILAEADATLGQLSSTLETILAQARQAIDDADTSIASTLLRWEEKKQAAQAAYERILRELQKSSVDGEAFIRLRRQVEELRPLKERQESLRRDLADLEQHRRNLFAEWENVRGDEFRQLERAAKKVNRQLENRVRVQVIFAGEREPLFALLREEIGGRLSEAIEVLRKRDALSPSEFAETLRAGAEPLQKKYGIPPSQAERLAAASPDAIMQIEELDLPSTTTIELNVAGEGQAANWQKLQDLSTGQKATAVLLLLLLESDAPLIIDQPEDDLDNRFITEGIVPKMREEKQRRQFIFSTHNANIPVLGDAELIIGLRASGEAGQGYAEIPVVHMGSIDATPVRELVEEILEGGKTAFEMRRLKYGF